ncbi:MAG: hypothetical protein ACREMO_06235, partial [Gemmatimonadales bacterium]
MLALPRRSRTPALTFCLWLAAGISGVAAQGGGGGAVSGKVSLIDRGDRLAEDVGQAVVWLEAAPANGAPPAQVEMSTEG